MLEPSLILAYPISALDLFTSAYELMTEQQRQKSHMQYGMTLCSYMDYNCDNNDLFFTAINQINNGGPSVVSDPNQRSILAKMNLNAGKLSIALSDYTTALSLFEHGISYLEDEKWASDYELSLNLFDAAAEAACVLNKNAAVTSYTEEIVANAKSFDDSLNCEYSNGIYISERWNKFSNHFTWLGCVNIHRFGCYCQSASPG